MIRWPAGFLPPHVLLSVDPGKHHLGWALFVNGLLVGCGVLKCRFAQRGDTRPPTYRQDVPEGVAHAQVELVSVLALEVARIIPGAAVLEVIVETMRVYDGAAKSQPATMLDVERTVGAVLATFPAARHRLVFAATWKGQLADAPTWAMCRRPLEVSEIAVAIDAQVYDNRDRKDFHHGLEAIGIGLWGLWRV